MSTNQLPNGAISEIPPSEPDPAQSAPGLSSTAAGDPGLLDPREPITNQTFIAHSLPRGIIHSSIDSTHGRVRFDSPSNPGATVPGAIRTGTWRAEKDGRLVENMLVPIPDEEPERINTTSPPNNPSHLQESSHFRDEENRDRGGGESEAPHVMWHGGEEYYEETYGRHGRIASPTFLPLSPAALRAIRTGLTGRAATTRAEDLEGGNTNWSHPTALTFLDITREIDISLITHAPRTGLPLPPL